MDLQQLKSHLWNCAEILRGSAVDRTDWKGYILPLLFFQRISDVWDEETTEAAAMFGDTEPSLFSEIHRFEVAEGCHWRDVRETAISVGAALSHAMREIERANPIRCIVSSVSPTGVTGKCSRTNFSRILSRGCRKFPSVTTL